MNLLPSAGLDDAAFAAALRLRRALDLQLDPHLPATNAAELRARFGDDLSEHAEHDRVLLFDGADALAIGHLQRDLDPANRHFAAFEIEMLQDDTALTRLVLAELVRLAVADKRTSMMAWGVDSPWRNRFYAELGVPRRYSERISELEIGAVDGDLMKSWIDRRHERAGEFRLVAWQGPCPDAWLPANVTMTNAMNDAPREGLDYADWEHDGAEIRREERALDALGETPLVLLAVDASDRPAGKTCVMLNRHRPAASWQYDTVVPPSHRNRGIGRWLKAEMWRRLRKDHPDVTHLRTGNAESNAAMLAINVAMGYRESQVYAAWQADTGVYREALSRTPSSR